MLTVTRPTRTTTLYTVSNRAANADLTSRTKTVLLLALRLIAGLVVGTILLREYRLVYPSSLPGASRQQWLENIVLDSPSGRLADVAATRITRIWRLLACSAVTWLIFRRSYTEESLLVIRGLGVQTSSSSASYLWASSTRFIPTSSVQDMLIHEAFKGFEVRYYLSIVVEGESDVVVVFPNLLPRREIVEGVWRGVRACLYEPSKS